MEGERGRGVGRVLKDRDGNLTMIVDATLSDNSTLSVQLSPSK
jgi:glycerol-3-phosphate O-acyltransferase